MDKVLLLIKDVLQVAPLSKNAMVHGILIGKYYLGSICFVFISLVVAVCLIVFLVWNDTVICTCVFD